MQTTTPTHTLTEIQEVFRETFQNDELVIGPETTAAEVEGWDSLMHVTLMVNVEAQFAVRFSSTQVATLKNVGELVALVDAQRT